MAGRLRGILSEAKRALERTILTDKNKTVAMMPVAFDSF
jgi:hypothetical protein